MYLYLVCVVRERKGEGIEGGKEVGREGGRERAEGENILIPDVP